MSWLAPLPPAEVRPFHVQIEVTWRCNWRCVHCYQDDHEVEILTLGDFERLFDQLVSAGTLHVILTGGEPLVRADLFDIVAAARRRRLGVTLYTNAHRVTAAVAARLAPSIAVAEVSILAGDDAIHDDLCGVRGASARAWNGIEHLRAVGIDVIVKTPLLAPAAATFVALEARVRALGLAWNPDPDISRSYAGADFPLHHRLSDAGVARFHAELPAYRPGGGVRSSDPGAPAGICLAGRQYAFVDARGDVYPCLNFKGASDARAGGGEPARAHLGNIRDRPFVEIWNAPGILTEIRGATGASFGRCASCAGTCSPCMAASFEEYGQLFVPATTICAAGQVAAGVVHLPIIR